MNLHEHLRLALAKVHQNWRAFSYLIQVHENHYTKRAGVAGIRARATGDNGENSVPPLTFFLLQFGSRVQANIETSTINVTGKIVTCDYGLVLLKPAMRSNL
ncbi:hypothetical protein [Klebsiella variicola]|uniref:Uncharacterized protein n=1 Tax=Klebsiella variicola TaxID=244366 RepID=A0A7H0EUQ1_KLEVA|nr:hypothetical protein [Klebsiella variicola]QNP27517.1 hypothetical protein IAP99_06080 [Klebsiella variicola]